MPRMRMRGSHFGHSRAGGRHARQARRYRMDCGTNPVGTRRIPIPFSGDRATVAASAANAAMLMLLQLLNAEK